MRALAAALVLVPALAHADAKDDARALAQKARPLAEQGVAENDTAKLTEAARLYEQAYATDPNPVYQCNAAIAHRVLGALPRAHALFSRCMARLPAVQPSAVPAFRGQVDELERVLPEKHVAVDVATTPAGAAVAVSAIGDGVDVIAPAVVWLPEGVHDVTARMPGYRDASEQVTVTGDDVAGHPRKSVRLTLEREVVQPEVVEKVVEKPVTVSSGHRTAAWIAIGGGAVLLAGGGVMHAITARTRSELAGLTGDEYEAKLPTFKQQRTATIVLYGAGAAAAVTGAVLLYLSPKHGDRVGVAPGPGGDGATLWIDLSP